jgi:hypothetical protein
MRRTPESVNDDGFGSVATERHAILVQMVRTLDAVHIATAESLGEAPQLMSIVTRDHRVRENAKALGYAVE